MKLNCVERKYITAGLNKMILDSKSQNETKLIANLIKKINGGIRYEFIKKVKDE